MAVPVIEGSINTNSGGSTVSSLTLTAPSGIAADELLLIIVGSDDTGDPAEFTTAASGWTKLLEAGDSLSDCHIGVFWKIAAGSEGNIQIDAASTDEMLGWYMRISGVDTTTPINDSSSSRANGRTAIVYHATAVPITTTVDECLCIGACVTDGGDTTPFGTISGTGWSKLSGAEQESGTTGNDVAGDVATVEQTTAGTPAESTASQQVTDGIAFATIGIAPGAAAAGSLVYNPSRLINNFLVR